MSDAKAMADRLLQEGLQLYGEGRLDEALGRWQSALSHVPDLEMARQYMQYVQDNRAALEQNFAYARATSGSGWEAVGGQAPRAAVDPSPVDQGQSPQMASPVAQQQPRPRNDSVPTARSPSNDLLQAMNWDTVRGGSHTTQADEDLTPRINLGIAQPGLTPPKKAGGDEPTWQRESSPGRSSALRPVAREGATTDFDAPEPTTGSLGLLDTPVEVAHAAGVHAIGSPKPAERPKDNMWVRGRGGRAPGEPAEFDRVEQTTSNVLTPESEPRLGVVQPSVDLSVGGAQPEAVARSERPTPGGAQPAAVEAEVLLERFSRLPDAEAAKQADEMLNGALQLFQQGAYEGSLWLCERVLALHKETPQAQILLEQNRGVLLEQYQRKLADLDKVPVVCMPQEQILWHKLDHRAGFILSRVDGVLTYGDILDISGMSNFEAYRILVQLVDQRVIGPVR